MKGRIWLWLVAAFAVALATAPLASARLYKVTRSGDPSPGACKRDDCSLREAIRAASATPATPDKVVLPNARRDYRLAIPNANPTMNEDAGLTGDLDASNVTIFHRGQGRATVSQQVPDRVIEGLGRVGLQRVRIIGGNSDGLASDNDNGGGIRAHAALRVKSSHVADNLGDHGGGIAVEEAGSLRLIGSRVAGNRDSDSGAGVWLSDALPSAIVRSEIVGNEMINDNEGGGVTVGSTRLRITASTIAGNRSEREAGGVNAFDAELTIKDSTIARNSAPESGGGLYLYAGETKIVNSTIAGNRTGEEGGGITLLNGANLSVNAVTIARNVANTDDTLSETGGGLAIDPPSTASVRNSLIALNRLGPGPRNDCSGTPVASGGGNLISTLGPSSACQGFTGPQDVVRANARLGALRYNGGPTKTVSLKRGSKAIGNARRQSAPGRDQRGRKRDRHPDSGAFER